MVAAAVVDLGLLLFGDVDDVSNDDEGEKELDDASVVGVVVVVDADGDDVDAAPFISSASIMK